MIALEDSLLLLLLIFARIAGLFSTAPVISARQIPMQVKGMMAFMMALILLNGRAVALPPQITTPGFFVAALVVEAMVGYALGLVANVVFAGVQTAGQLMDMQMGFGIVNVLDPQSGIQLPLLGNFLYILSLMVYLAINGHHYLISAIYQSYDILPILAMHLNHGFVEFFIHLLGQMFILAIKISIPLVAAMFVADVAMGFMSRTVPQMNIFVVGLPVKIAGGLIMLLMFMPVYIWLTQVMFENWIPYLDQAVYLLGK
ncbi:MAG: flagellar biosynthetic protein FliR [Methylocystaceae bacterium]